MSNSFSPRIAPILRPAETLGSETKTYSESAPKKPRSDIAPIPFTKRYLSRGRLFIYFRPPRSMASLNGMFLGHTEQEAREKVRHLLRQIPSKAERDPWAGPTGQERYKGAVRDMLSESLKRARKGAVQRGLAFEIDQAFIWELLERQNWRCAVTGIQFRHRTNVGKTALREPFRPSIDRIENGYGYTRNNCRIVCVAVNVALGAWGDAVFEEIVRGAAARLGPPKRIVSDGYERSPGWHILK